MDITSLKAAYLDLSAEQKDVFCDYALSFLHEKEDVDISTAWLKEAKTRLQECTANSNLLIPAQQVLAELHHGL